MYAIEAHQITKNYWDGDQQIQVLTGVNLNVETGELLCITGKSGCGKSTLLHILGLLDTQDSGKVLIAGKEIDSKSKEAPYIRNKDLGFVFQFHYLIEDLTATENVALPMLIGGVTISKATKRACELLTGLGLNDRLNRYPNQLSGGEQQRVSLARALANDPKIVLADEPTGNLDPAHSGEVWDMMLKLNREMGQAFIIVTHDAESARKAHKLYDLHDGELYLS